ncbi:MULTISPECIES: cation transporter [unclassified Leifsonia]|uniref:cation transporter n=1 Tax=unclassified Leifsonia TaxID=2663824 RepID=UPI0008A72883|nr:MULTISPECIES: cation transporter [unclassified Leifsonia]SEH84605.1 Cation efflux family protein [Leifsonia sp. CL154]SFL47218.1 Cation efflux family protein [Leifsonia sp. CL147]
MTATTLSMDARRRLVRTGIGLEAITLAWNVVGVAVLAVLAYASASVALLGFGLDSLIEIFASIVVIWELTGVDERRQRLALRLIGVAFALLAVYLLAQAAVALVAGHRAAPTPAGAGWTAATAVAMFALAFGKARVGRRLGNRVLITEGRVTLVDGILACSVLVGIALDGLFGWWWADPAAGLVIVVYAVREAVQIFRE